MRHIERNNGPQVLHCMWSGGIGGAERAVFQFIRSQIQRSHYRPAIAYSRAQGFYGDEIRSLGVEVIDLGLKSDISFTQALRIRKLIARFPIHQFHSAEITPMLASVLCPGVRRIYTHRSGDSEYFGRQRARYEIVGFMARNYFQGLVGNTGCASTSGAHVTRTHVSKWRTIYNGIDFSMLRPRRPREAVASEISLQLDGSVVIGTSARLTDVKRIELLIQACAKLKPGSFWLLIVGDGPARTNLEALSRQLEIDIRTVFPGMKEHIGDYLQLMDVFVLPSSSAESFGNSAVEAMSQGLPTIVFSDGGGLLEHITDGKTGFIVSSTEELSARLTDLALRPELRLRLGDAARDYVTQRYSCENLVASYDDLYDELLSS